MSAYVNLQVWPDTHDVLPLLRELGVSLGILSNMTAETLESSLMRANLRGMFAQVLSTDRVRSFKPARAAYQLGVVPEELGVSPEGTGSDLHSLLSFLQARAA